MKYPAMRIACLFFTIAGVATFIMAACYQQMQTGGNPVLPATSIASECVARHSYENCTTIWEGQVNGQRTTVSTIAMRPNPASVDPPDSRWAVVEVAQGEGEDWVTNAKAYALPNPVDFVGITAVNGVVLTISEVSPTARTVQRLGGRTFTFDLTTRQFFEHDVPIETRLYNAYPLVAMTRWRAQAAH